MKDLNGLKINSLELSTDKTVLKINTDKGPIYLVAVGDCCSSSWFEHISGTNNVIGGIINDFSHLDLYSNSFADENPGEYEHIQYYSTVIKTNKGQLELEYRNSSNGYYGGWLTIDETEYGRKIDSSKYEFNPLNGDI